MTLNGLTGFIGKSLKRKIMFNALVILVVLSGIVLFLTSRFTMGHFYRMAEDNVSFQLEARARFLEQRLEQKGAVVRSLNRQLQWNVERRGQSLPEDWVEQYNIVAGLTVMQEQTDEDFSTVFLIMPDLRMHSSRDPQAVLQASQDQWDWAMDQQNQGVSDMVESPYSDETLSVITQPLIINGQVAGVLGATLPLRGLDELNIRFQNEIDRSIYVLDSQGRYLVHPDPGRRLEKSLLDVSAGDHGQTAVHSNDRGETQRLFVSELAGTPGWKVVAAVPESLLFREIGQMRRLNILVINVGLLVLAALAYLLASSVTRPLVEMQQVFERAASGDLFVRAEVRSRDELGRAAHSFNRMIERLRKMTYFDGLTDLPNMKYFLYNMETKSRQSSPEDRFAVVLVSVNGFKKINETYGFNSGDEILVELSRRLKRHVENAEVMDYVARFSGDEFIVFLTGISSKEELEHEMIGILQTVNKPYFGENHQLSVRCTLGALFFDGQTEMDHDQLVSTVSLARSQAKLSKAPYTILTGEETANSQIRHHKMIENDLYKAIEFGELEVYYHPIFDLHKRQVVSLEALLRWRHPEQGYIPPDVFIPIAEESGQIGSIGRWVMRNACAQMKTWQVEYPDLSVSVNISPEQFIQKDFIQQLLDTLCEIDYNPQRLHLEITEEVGLFNLEEQDEKLVFLNDWGVRISVDDFGTGYSSFRYLAQLSIDQVKIDRSFVRDMENSDKSKAIVKTIVSMAEALKLDCVAEGVETPQQLEYLRSLGCGKIQGYLLTKPLPADEMEVWLKAYVRAEA